MSDQICTCSATRYAILRSTDKEAAAALNTTIVVQADRIGRITKQRTLPSLMQLPRAPRI